LITYDGFDTDCAAKEKQTNKLKTAKKDINNFFMKKAGNKKYNADLINFQNKKSN